VTLGVSGIALADGGTDNTSNVLIGVSKKKLPKKKGDAKKISLTSGVTTVDTDNNPVVPDQAAEVVNIDYDKDLYLSFKGITPCTANLLGTTTEAARAACPNSIVSSAGSAKARLPNFPAPNNEVTDITVTAFVGATPNDIRLHAATPTLGPGATQVVEGKLGKSPTAGYGTRLSVPDAPDLAGDVGALTAFQATLNKGVKATCKDKKIKTHAEFTYDDGSKDSADASISCKQKKK
jgi:hypothetical protein